MESRVVPTPGLGPAILCDISVRAAPEALHKTTACQKPLSQLYLPPSTKPRVITALATSGEEKNTVKDE
jgi:hypothetical protein